MLVSLLLLNELLLNELIIVMITKCSAMNKHFLKEKKNEVPFSPLFLLN